MYCGREKSNVSSFIRLMDGNRRGRNNHLPLLLRRGKYLFCRFSAYLQVPLAIYNHLALYVIDVCIRPLTATESATGFEWSCCRYTFIVTAQRNDRLSGEASGHTESVQVSWGQKRARLLDE